METVIYLLMYLSVFLVISIGLIIIGLTSVFLVALSYALFNTTGGK